MTECNWRSWRDFSAQYALEIDAMGLGANDSEHFQEDDLIGFAVNVSTVKLEIRVRNETQFTEETGYIDFVHLGFFARRHFCRFLWFRFLLHLD